MDIARNNLRSLVANIAGGALQLLSAAPTDVNKTALLACAAVGAVQMLGFGVDFLRGIRKHLLRPRMNLKARYGNGVSEPWAVVTGGAGGIGRAYAMELAGAGFNLIVIDRDVKGLASMKSDLEGKVQVETITFDFAELGTMAGFSKLEKLVGEAAAEKDVAVLVNNVAEFQHKLLEDAPWSYVLRASNVNAHSYAAMAKLLVPGFAERNEKAGARSAVINVGTCAAEPWNPRFQFAIYGATKAYTHILSSSLREVHSKHIDVLTAVPRQTETEMNPAGYMFTVQPAQHAKAVVDQLGYEAETYGPLVHCLEYNLRFKYQLFGLFDSYVQWCNLSKNVGLVKAYNKRA